MKWMHLKDVTLRYQLSGQGPQTLVLLHELGGSLESFDRLLPPLGDRLRVLRHDLRGAGLSEKPRSAFSFDDHVSDLRQLLVAAGIDGRIHIAGVAAGAAIAVSFALRHPDRVASLALCAPALGVDADRIHYLSRRAELCMRAGMRAVADDTLDRSYPTVMRRDHAAYLSYLGRFLANDPVGYAHNNLAFAKVNLLGRLKELPHRCLLLAGAHDTLRPPDQVAAVARMLPHAELAMVESGHLMPVQAPAEMAQRLMAFLAQSAGDVGCLASRSEAPHADQGV
jgi:3-oxoadipate enol-lactonase